MKNISEYIQEIWLNSLKSIDQNIVYDIYAFSFYVYDDEDDLRCPSLTIGYNTLSNLKKQVDNASNELEAKWNYAYWMQNEIAIVGNEEDIEGKSIISDWISNMGLNYSDKEENEDFETCLQKSERITENFVKILIGIVQETHNNEITIKPILIHELEYYDKIRDQNIEANGKERVIEFINWIDEM